MTNQKLKYHLLCPLKLNVAYTSTTYSPRYEFVTVRLFTQIRIYRVYIDDRYLLDRY